MNLVDFPTLCIKRALLLETLRNLADNNLKFYRWGWHRFYRYSKEFTFCCEQILETIASVEPDVKFVAEMAPKYDFEDVPGNGYRSIVALVDTCLLHLIRLLFRIAQKRSSLVFPSRHFCRELQSYTGLFASLQYGVSYAKRFVEFSQDGELFPELDDETFRNLITEVDSLDQKYFFGRSLGFQFVSSLLYPFHLISIGLAAFSDGYEYDDAGGILPMAIALLSTGKYALSPEKRAERIVQVTRDADISFCQTFWAIPEGELFQHAAASLCPSLAINEVLQLPSNQPITVKGNRGTVVTVDPPCAHTGTRPLKARLLSYHVRQGMKCRLYATDTVTLPKSRSMVLHCHGGGFVAQSSRSHETYLRDWAKRLNMPILSVDYSLAPDNPYPRQQEELLYAYAWALNNSDMLGWTGEVVCFAGDSAGGNIILGALLRVIEAGFAKLPDGLFLAYTPVTIRYIPSPSRFLSLLDPILPFGVVSRCMAAYTGNTEAFDLATWPERKRQVSLAKKRGRRASRKSSTCAGYTQSRSRRNSDVRQRFQSRIVTVSECRASPSTSESESMSSSSDSEAEVDVRAHKTSVLSDKQLFEIFQGTQNFAAMGTNLAERTGMEAKPEMEGMDPVEIRSNTEHVYLNRANYDVDFMALLEPLHEPGQLGAKRLISVCESSNALHRNMSSSSSTSSTAAAAGTKSSVKWWRPNPWRTLTATVLAVGAYVAHGIAGWLQWPFGVSTFTGEALMYSAKSERPSKRTTPVFSLSGSDPGSLHRAVSAESLATTHALHRFRSMIIPKDPFLSPLYASKELLEQLPPTYLVGSHLDPLLDDSVMFARRLKDCNVPVKLDLVEGLPHGFLNLAVVSRECHVAATLCMQRIKQACASKTVQV